MADIHDELLTDMAAVRKAIAPRYRWYYHVTPSKKAGSIRDHGLLTNRDAPPPPSVVRHLGEPAGSIICLNPLGTDEVPPAVQPPPYICVALSMAALPQRLSLDWTFGGCFELAEVLRQENPQRSATDIFLECVKRRGSIVVYDLISREHLHVCCKGCRPHDPTNWPKLIATSDDMLVTF